MSRPGGDPISISRRIRLRLGNFWRCLESSLLKTAQDRWPAENPYAVSPAPTNPRPPAGLPDPDVIYQLVLGQPGDVIQVLSEFRLEPPTTGVPRYACYSVRNFPAKVGDTGWRCEISALLPWGADPAQPEDFYLEVKLIPTGAPPPPVPVRRAISSRHNFLFADGVVPPGLTLSTQPREAALVTMRVMSATELASLRILLLTPPRDLAFLTSAKRFLDRLQTLLDNAVVDIRTWQEVAEPVSFGLEQLRELVPDPATVVFNSGGGPNAT